MSGATNGAEEPVIRLWQLTKTYGEGEAAVHALRGVTMSVHRGDYVAIMGASGSGKSTLMSILGCLDVQTTGRYLLDGIDVEMLYEDELSEIRNRKIGFVFQSFNLLPGSSALQNVELPLTYAKVRSGERRARALAALQAVGLDKRASHRPAMMSGGERQRVAVARAIAVDPSLILADEPTGNLDSARSLEIVELLADVAHEGGAAVLLVTHDVEAAGVADRFCTLRDGKLLDDRDDRAEVGVASR